MQSQEYKFMKKKNFYSLVIVNLILIHSFSYSQTKIFLRSTIPYHFEIINRRDTNYIFIEYQEDMGAKREYYKFKEIIPDARYHVYVNNNLQQEGSFKNNQKNGAWINYYPNGKEITPYKDGEIEGIYKRLYADGSLETIAKISNGIMPIRTHYYRNGKPKMREYFIKENVRVEWFNENGTIKMINNKEIVSPEGQVHLTLSEEKFKNGKLDGESEFWYTEGHFKVLFRENKILKWQYFNKQSELVMEE